MPKKIKIFTNVQKKFKFSANAKKNNLMWQMREFQKYWHNWIICHFQEGKAIVFV